MNGRLVRALLVCALFAFAAPALADPVVTDNGSTSYWSDSPEGTGSVASRVFKRHEGCVYFLQDATIIQAPILGVSTAGVDVQFDNDLAAAQGAGANATLSVQACNRSNANSCGNAWDPPIVLTGQSAEFGATPLTAPYLRFVLSGCGSGLCSIAVCGRD